MQNSGRGLLSVAFLRERFSTATHKMGRQKKTVDCYASSNDFDDPKTKNTLPIKRQKKKKDVKGQNTAITFRIYKQFHIKESENITIHEWKCHLIESWNSRKSIP